MTQDRIAELKEVKKKRSLSYEALGHELGVHSMSVYRWLQKGVVPRSRPVLQVIDRFLAKNKKGDRVLMAGAAGKSSLRGTKGGS
jgi:transcriptional regulator with XRE-family HTH domain